MGVGKKVCAFFYMARLCFRSSGKIRIYCSLLVLLIPFQKKRLSFNAPTTFVSGILSRLLRKNKYIIGNFNKSKCQEISDGIDFIILW